MRRTLATLALIGTSLGAIPATAAAAQADDLPGVWTCQSAEPSKELPGAIVGVDCKGPAGHYVPGSLFTEAGGWHCASAVGIKQEDTIAVGGLGCTKS
ncbi:hypothetical protein [Streptomyces sp. NBC_01304]|uniref:hypothetical protein n=1 Tax=Streptomyces sp. NBC_01304 TaxID=2903818 RepID=UPI002E13FB89|nr:hypothetical protein OG430_01355 [Streptomyces sp. NBC_01304]